jgi:hypothetical protein
VLFLGGVEGQIVPKKEAWDDNACWVKVWDQTNYRGQERTYYRSSYSVSNFNVKSLKVKPNCVAMFTKKVEHSVQPEANDRLIVNGFSYWNLGAYGFKMDFGVWEDEIKSYVLSPLDDSRMNCRATLYEIEETDQTHGYQRTIPVGEMEEIYQSKNVNLLKAKSLELAKGCCVTLFTGENYGGEQQRVCNSKIGLGYLNNRVRSIRMEQRPYPSCRIEFTKYGGAKEVYGSGTPNVNGITAYKIQHGCKARFFTQKNYGGEITGFVSPAGTFYKKQDIGMQPFQIRSFLLLLPDAPNCQVYLLINKKKVVVSTPQESLNNVGLLYLKKGCIATVFTEPGYKGVATRLSALKKTVFLKKKDSAKIKSILVDQV